MLFFKILGFAEKRFLLSPPPPLSFLFLLSSQLSRRTHAETLAMQARIFEVKIYYIRSRRPLGTYSYRTSSRSIWIACPWLDRKKFFWPISEEEQLGVSGVLLHDVVSLINHHSWVRCSKGKVYWGKLHNKNIKFEKLEKLQALVRLQETTISDEFLRWICQRYDKFLLLIHDAWLSLSTPLQTLPSIQLQAYILDLHVC